MGDPPGKYTKNFHKCRSKRQIRSWSGSREIRVYGMVGDHKRPHSTRQARLEKRQKIRHSFGIWIGLNRVWKYFCGLVDNNYMYMYMNAYDISSMIVLADTCPNDQSQPKRARSAGYSGEFQSGPSQQQVS